MTQRKCTLALALIAMAAALALPRAGMTQGEVLTVEKAVSLAETKGPGLGSAKYSVEAARHARWKSFAGFFPVFSTEIRALYYSEKSSISGDMPSFEFDPSSIPPPESTFDSFVSEVFTSMADMFGSFGSFESEQYDVNITITMTQPLTPLYQVYCGYKIAELGIDLAELEVVRTEEELRYQVKESYYSILKLKHGIEAMDEGIASVTAHVQKAELFFQQKIITKNDLLQAKARLAQLEAERIALEGTLGVAYEGLNTVTGLAPGSQPDLMEPEKAFSGEIPSFEEAMNVAMENRTDIKKLELQVKQAELAKNVAVGNYLPKLAAMGMYQHNEGSVMKLPPFAVGGVLSWEFWSFGSRYYEVKEVEAMKMAAKEGLSALKSSVAVEIRESISRLKVAIETLEKADASVLASEEQLRIENARYAQNVATSTDVLDAQTRLTEALLQRENSWYDIYIALAKIEKATGKNWQ